jgi:hypothetical protein
MAQKGTWLRTSAGWGFIYGAEEKYTLKIDMAVRDVSDAQTLL